MRTIVPIVLALLLAGCAVSGTPLISEEERCTRYGGLWRATDGGVCSGPGGAGN